ncbi:MAG: SsrA-binding protein SmpB [Phycisphaerae bacterium]|nr:SsrA-binding protein SmpB [Phycisphaerae bacterium]
MGKSGERSTKQILNKKARFDYHLFDRIEAGIELKGSEVKSLRAGTATLSDAYARIDGGRVALVNFQIEPYPMATHFNHDPKRPKQLLLHKREIRKLASKLSTKGFTLIPLAVYFNARGRAKVELALARGKTKSDKRQSLRAREDQREIDRATRRR